MRLPRNTSGFMKFGILLRRDAFTLVELLVALALTGIAMIAIYRSFSAQQKVYIAQDQAVEMQQDLRAAMMIMTKAIRMAGYDPTSSGQFGFNTLPNAGAPDYGRYTSNDGMSFYVDDNEDGGVNSADAEQVAFRLNVDQNGNALAAGARDNVLRVYSTGVVKWQPLAENVEALDFVYLDETGAIIASPIAAADLPRIRSVQITVLARSDKMDRDYVNNNLYANPQGTPLLPGPPGDGYRRRILTTTVQCRNTGL